ncbi:MAG TPA: hypothetical protein VE685_01260 [Thermoanaerobaculia bacterium]|nr:hypothetical protein [Thermoanaerobaculia bacterium]
MTRHILFTSFLLLSLSACGGDDSASDAAMAGESPAADASTAPPASDAPVGPISSRGEVVPGGGGGAGGPAGGLNFDLPAGWQSEQPSSSMRMAQASIPGPGGPGQLTVFYFGPGGGGGVEANIERWIGQMEVAAGTQPAQETFDANGYRVTVIDVKGTLLPSTMGTGPETPQPDSRLLGAVVEGPGGPWFFKATGPEATLAAERDAFLSMLRSVRGQ